MAEQTTAGKEISLDQLVAMDEAARKAKEEAPQEAAGGLPPEKGLEILGIEPETLTVKAQRGKEVEVVEISVSPMCMDQIADFLVAAEDLLPLIQADSKGGMLPIARMLAKDKKAVWKAIAIACNESPDLIGRLLPNDFIRVVTKVFVLNLDFFVRQLPVALGVAERSVLSAVSNMTQAMPGLSNALSRMGIAS